MRPFGYSSAECPSVSTSKSCVGVLHASRFPCQDSSVVVTLMRADPFRLRSFPDRRRLERFVTVLPCPLTLWRQRTRLLTSDGFCLAAFRQAARLTVLEPRLDVLFARAVLLAFRAATLAARCRPVLQLTVFMSPIRASKQPFALNTDGTRLPVLPCARSPADSGSPSSREEPIVAPYSGHITNRLRSVGTGTPRLHLDIPRTYRRLFALRSFRVVNTSRLR